MDINNVSNLFIYLKDKYGEDSVRLLRLWEFTVNKMMDNRNHRRFTLRCIKEGITPVSCKIRNPLKTVKSYQIIHKAEKQLLYKRIRNINCIPYMNEYNRSKVYSQLRDPISEEDIVECIHLVSNIKEFRYNKAKKREIDKFERLVKITNGYTSGYLYNFQNSLRRHPPNSAHRLHSIYPSNFRAITIANNTISLAPTSAPTPATTSTNTSAQQTTKGKGP